MNVEENKRVLAEFDQLLGSDDLSPLERLCTPDMTQYLVQYGPDTAIGMAAAGCSMATESTRPSIATVRAWRRVR